MSKRNKKRLTRRQQEIRRKRLKKRRRRRRLVIILELIILCILGTTAFGLFKLGKMERTNLSNIKNNGLNRPDIPMLHYLVWIQEKRILEKETGQIRL